MKAFELKTRVEDLLEHYSAGRFVIISARKKSDAESIFTKPTVTVFYSEGSFDKKKSGVNSPYHHDASYNIHLNVASKATANLKVLQDPAAKPEQIAIALAESNNAVLLADAKLDELIALVYDIIMRPEHRKLGFDEVPNRWVPLIQKHQSPPLGAIVTASATITLTLQTMEKVTSAVATPGNTVDTIVNPGGESKQGAEA